MINSQMRDYQYFIYGEQDAYGQPTLSTEPVGTVKMAINVLNTQIQNNAIYKEAEYLGLTNDAEINDSWVIACGSDQLKVKYVNPAGRLKQVFMQRCSL